MSKRIGFLVAIATVMIGTGGTGWAQSAYDYPYCALRGGRSGGQSCYFTSYRQCMDSLIGIGGNCIQNPGYRGAGPRVRRNYGDRY